MFLFLVADWGCFQIGSKALVNLTKALDVKVQFEESITSSKGTVKILGTQYQVDTVSGKIAISNNKKEAVTVQVKVKILGSLTEHSVTPKTNIEEITYDVANGVRKVMWEITLEPGKKEEILFKRVINRN